MVYNAGSQGFFGPRTPVDNLYAGPIALQYFKYKELLNPVVVSPDAGGVYRAKTFKEGLEVAYYVQAHPLLPLIPCT